MELLVTHLPDLVTGRVVPVGDAFDALAESEDPIDDPVMKARFDRARDLYRESFQPCLPSEIGHGLIARETMNVDDANATLGEWKRGATSTEGGA
jgi:hypothetical protein